MFGPFVHGVVITAIVYLILYYSNSTPATPPLYILSMVYSNAMMANLNHRIEFSGGRNDDTYTISFSTTPSPILSTLVSDVATNDDTIQEKIP